MNNETIAQNLRKTLEFYQEIGFEYMPFKAVTSNIKDSNESIITSNELKTKDLSLVTCHSSLNKEAALKALREEIGDCKRCKLSKGRTNIVFGEGNPNAELIFIGEGPGAEEDRQGRPFVGEAGGILTNLIKKMGFKREDVYIANIVKCRPPMNRDPEEDEVSTCMPFVQEQIRIINPKVIMALGRVAAQSLLQSKVPISKLRGRFYEYKDIPLMPTFHPAYLLRNPKDKWLTWNDAQMVLERLKTSG